jgi:hypothetical protein
MYDLKTLSLYLLVFFSIALLGFPEQIQRFAPNNQYMKMLIEYKQSIALAFIFSAIYLYSTSVSSEIKQVSSDSATVTTTSVSTTETPQSS